MFRKRAAEILRRGLKSLEELDATEESERLIAVPIVPVVEGKNPFPNGSSEPGSLSVMDSAVIEALSASFDPSDSF